MAHGSESEVENAEMVEAAEMRRSDGADLPGVIHEREHSAVAQSTGEMDSRPLAG